MGEARRRRLAGCGPPPRRLTSWFLKASASELTNAKFAQRLGVPLTQPIVFPVFETTLGEKTVYGCLAGGHRDRDGEVRFTEMGQAALEALLRLSTAAEPVILQELKLGQVPLHRKIRETVEAAPPGARICFFGDMAGELDGVALKALNVQAGTRPGSERLSSCRPYAR